MGHQAIETEYNGYRFRSRLEARWAVFFDEMRVRYKYEEYAFEKNEVIGPDEVDSLFRWLPDFYLPDHGIWVEVKGGKPSQRDAEKMARLLDWGSPLAFFDNSADFGDTRPQPDWLLRNGKEPSPLTTQYREMGGEDRNKFRPGLLLLGDVPYLHHGIVVHSFVTHHKGLVCQAGYFESTGNFHLMEESEWFMFRRFTGVEWDGPETLDSYGSGAEEQISFFTPSTFPAETQLAHTVPVSAYSVARAARFEHGQTPVPFSRKAMS